MNQAPPTGPESYMNASFTKLLRLSLFSTFLLLVTHSACWAGLMKGDIIKLSRTGTLGGASGGGEFAIHKRVANTNDWSRLDQVTFCLEFNEYITLGEELYVAGISDRSVFGGVGGSVNNAGDPLSAQTQFLYKSYVTGQLASAGLNYTPNKAWANAMQQAVWFLEEEISSSTPKLPHTQTLLNYANSYTGPLLDTEVFALNLFKWVPNRETQLAAFDPTNTGTWGAIADLKKQDQLYYVAPQPVVVSGQAPEPASMAVWLTASLVGIFSRFRRLRTA